MDTWCVRFVTRTVALGVLIGFISPSMAQPLPSMEVVREASAAREAALSSLHVQLGRIVYVLNTSKSTPEPEVLPLEVLTADYDWRDGIAHYSEALVGTSGGLRNGRATYSMMVESPEESVWSIFSAVPRRPEMPESESVWARMSCRTIRGEPTGRHNWIRWQVGLAKASSASLAASFSTEAQVVDWANIRGEVCVQVHDGDTDWFLAPRCGYAPVRKDVVDGVPDTLGYVRDLYDWLDYQKVGEIWLSHRQIAKLSRQAQGAKTGRIVPILQGQICSVKLAEVNLPREEATLGVPFFAGATIFDGGDLRWHGYSIDGLLHSALQKQWPWGFTAADLTAFD